MDSSRGCQRHAGLRRDDLQVLAAAERDERILGPAARMLSADTRFDARQPLEFRDAFFEAADGDDEMVELSQRRCQVLRGARGATGAKGAGANSANSANGASAFIVNPWSC